MKKYIIFVQSNFHANTTKNNTTGEIPSSKILLFTNLSRLDMFWTHLFNYLKIRKNKN